MICDFDIEEGVVVVHEDGAGFALIVDAEHLDAEFVDVCRRSSRTVRRGD